MLEKITSRTPDKSTFDAHSNALKPASLPHLTAVRRGVYLVPSALTTASLFLGFYAIVMAFDGSFQKAIIATVCAAFLDAMDGRVARMMNAASLFGANYDSLSDLVAFGVAPAVIFFNLGLAELGKAGPLWLVAFIYIACTALRLARFNSQLGGGRTFVGLPSPAAAAMMVTMLWFQLEYRILAADTLEFRLWLFAFPIVISLLMVSEIRYWSPGQVQLKSPVSFIWLVALVVVIALIFTDPPSVLLCYFLIYLLSGPLTSLWRSGRVMLRGGKHG